MWPFDPSTQKHEAHHNEYKPGCFRHFGIWYRLAIVDTLVPSCAQNDGVRMRLMGAWTCNACSRPEAHFSEVSAACATARCGSAEARQICCLLHSLPLFFYCFFSVLLAFPVSRCCFLRVYARFCCHAAASSRAALAPQTLTKTGFMLALSRCISEPTLPQVNMKVEKGPLKEDELHINIYMYIYIYIPVSCNGCFFSSFWQKLDISELRPYFGLEIVILALHNAAIFLWVVLEWRC